MQNIASKRYKSVLNKVSGKVDVSKNKKINKNVQNINDVKKTNNKISKNVTNIDKEITVKDDCFIPKNSDEFEEYNNKIKICEAEIIYCNRKLDIWKNRLNYKPNDKDLLNGIKYYENRSKYYENELMEVKDEAKKLINLMNDNLTNNMKSRLEIFKTATFEIMQEGPKSYEPIDFVKHFDNFVCKDEKSVDGFKFVIYSEESHFHKMMLMYKDGKLQGEDMIVQSYYYYKGSSSENFVTFFDFELEKGCKNKIQKYLKGGKDESEIFTSIDGIITNIL